jgi:hypothetical protein
MSTNSQTKGEALERLAFTFCKIATFCLLTGPYALPLAATGAALLFGAAYFSGKRDTRCIGKHPLLIATFWLFVLGIWIWRRFV